MKKEKLITPEQIQEEMGTLLLELDNEVERSKKEAEEISSKNEKLISKKNKLLDLGFTGSSVVKETSKIEKEIEEKKRLHGIIKREKELINKYRIEYPGYKFVPERIFNKVLEKYDIYTGPVSRFTGDVPEKCINDIAKFKDSYYQERYEVEETYIPSLGRSSNIVCKGSKEYCYNYMKRKEAEENRIGYTTLGTRIHRTCKLSPFNIKISAPVSEFNFDRYSSGVELQLRGRSLEEVKVDDPIVTYPVDGGHIIITAWGKEALDEDILNAEHN